MGCKITLERSSGQLWYKTRCEPRYEADHTPRSLPRGCCGCRR